MREEGEMEGRGWETAAALHNGAFFVFVAIHSPLTPVSSSTTISVAEVARKSEYFATHQVVLQGSEAESFLPAFRSLLYF